MKKNKTGESIEAEDADPDQAMICEGCDRVVGADWLTEVDGQYLCAACRGDE